MLLGVLNISPSIPFHTNLEAKSMQNCLFINLKTLLLIAIILQFFSSMIFPFLMLNWVLSLLPLLLLFLLQPLFFKKKKFKDVIEMKKNKEKKRPSALA
jgi:hypothetical protein